MNKKILAVILVAAMMLCALASCAKNNIDYGYTFADKTYVYEKEGVDSTFYIVINSDGTFSYSEGTGSGYLAKGTWTFVNSILTLKDDLGGSERNIVNNFFYVDGNLWYLTENSTGFPTVTVEEGDLFVFAYENAEPSFTTEEHDHDH